MKKSIIATIAAFSLVVPAAYGNPPQPPPTSISAGAGAAANNNLDLKVEGGSPSARVGNVSPKATGGSVGAVSPTAKVGDIAPKQDVQVTAPTTVNPTQIAGPSGNNDGATVGTNYSEQIHVMGGLPDQAGAAKTEVQVGLGVASVSGNLCGELKQVEEEDSEYVRTHLFKKDEKFTLKTQRSEHPVPYTELVYDHDHNVVMEPVLVDDKPVLVDGKPLMKPLKKVVPFRKIYFPNGNVLYKGSMVANRTRMTIGIATSNSFGVGGIGGSAAGSASYGNSSSATGNQEMDLVGECDYGTFREDPDGKLTAVVDARDELIKQQAELIRRMDCALHPGSSSCPTKAPGEK